MFKLQIVSAEDDREPADVVQMPGGGPLEVDFVDAATAAAVRHQAHPLDQLAFKQSLEEAIVRQGVGVFRTEAQVRRAIQQGLSEALQYQERTIRESIARGLDEAIRALKERTRALIRTR